MEHGGDILAATAKFGGAASDWLDLSTGIAPEPYPFTQPPADVYRRLPQQGRLDELLRAAREAYGASDTTAIVAAPGSQSLIQTLARRYPGRGAAIVGPTYTGHAQAWAGAGRPVRHVAHVGEAEPGETAIVVNPNNPDGRIHDPQALTAGADERARHGGLLVVDEAFADAIPAASAAPWSGVPGIVVLRSFGKFFGLAGVRLGFALGDERVISELRQVLGPWPVAGPAIEIGIEALSDHAWQVAARERYARDAGALDRLLVETGHEIIGGTPLFRLTKRSDARAMHVALARQHILTRVFEHDWNLIRYGLPGEANIGRLEAGLRAAAEVTSRR